MDPIAAALLTSFRRVPLAAVPAMLDCILTSTGSSPSSLFSSLLNEFPNLSKEIEQGDGQLETEQRNSMVSFIGGLCHLLKKLGANVFTMHLFTWKIWIPLLRLVHSYDLELFNEAARLFFDVMIEGDSWEVVEATIVPFLLRSVGLSLGMRESGELSTYKWTSYMTFWNSDEHLIYWPPSHVGNSTDNLDNDSILSQCDHFTLPVCCNILAMALDSALKSNCLEGSTSGMVLENERSSKIFAGNLLWDLSNITFQMLSESSEHRASAIRVLLPSIFKALASKCAFEALVCGQKCVVSRRHLSVKIWKSCRMLFALGSVERRDAYAVLSLYLSFFSFLDGCEDDLGAGDGKPFDLGTEEDFWAEIRRGLVDKESLVRKQSLYMLRAAVNLNKKNQSDSSVSDRTPSRRSLVPHGMTKRGLWADTEAKSLGVGRICNYSDLHSNSQQKWEAFLLLYEMLEEYGTHLVEAVWDHQISLLLHSSLQSDRSANSDVFELYHIRMETSEQIFGWLVVLWQRGFCHDNPQVRCLIMQSFLGIEWKNYGDYAKLVPEDFILGPFIQGLNDPTHHKDFGVKGVYSSWTIEAASKFVFQYASCLARRKQSSFLTNLASVAKKQSFGRSGLMCLVECIASAAHGFEGHTTIEIQQHDDSVEVIQVEDGQVNTFKNYEVELLEVLKYVIESSKQHFNPHYRYQVCKKILGAAASVLTAVDLPLEILLYFISSLPREYTDHGGLLRLKLQEWLLESNERPCTSSFCGSNLQLLKLLIGFPRSFVVLEHSKDTTISYDDDDLDAWESEANRWARTLFLVLEEELDLEPIFKFIQDYGIHICKQNTQMEWVPVKYLILASSLVHELEIIQERTKDSCMKGRVVKGVDIPDTAGHMSSTRYSIIFEKFAKSFFSILEELVSFATLSCSIFWSTMVAENGTLPGSIRGRLGGPSQRRLSSLTTTWILQAITSLKAVASISSWSTQSRNNVSLDSAFSFLWNFCWRIITAPTCQSETEAEISLAAYESLAYVLKSLVTTFSPLSLELLMANDNSTPVEEDHKPVLDDFVRTFLQNIDNLIAVGNFVRTRRAVLMNWKWICLESLLSIPNSALRNGVHMNSCNFFFSDVALRQIFGDLVDSLENAGEVSVLPMLRSVRLILELFASGQMGSLVSSCYGVTSQMMWHLVHSSWVLHVSCNKRRVAPIAALLSSVLHNSVFSNEHMHEFDNAPGPLKWFVERILEEGTRSPRTIRLAALHLTGLWLANPSIIKYYIKDLKLLTLYGSVAFDEDFEAELAENQDAKAEVSALSKSPDSELIEEFLNTELYARVSVAVLFYKLGEMDDDSVGSTNKNKSSMDAIASGKMFLLELLNSVINCKDLSKELYKKHSAIHRRKIRVWQMICILSRFTHQDIMEKVTCNLHISLQRNNLPSVRQYLETFAIHIYLKFPSLVGPELVPLLKNYNMRPQALASYVFIVANIILHSTEAFQSRHLSELLPPIIPLLTSHHHTLRGFTQLLVYQVLHKLLPGSGSSPSVTMSLEKSCFEDLKCYLADNPDCARLRASMEGYLDAFDPKTSITPSGVFSNRVEELDFECVPTSLMDRVINFLNDTREDLRCSMAKDAITIKNEGLHVTKALMSKRESVYSSDEPSSVMTHKISLDFQKKITFSRHDMQETTAAILDNDEPFKSLMDIETEDQLFYELLHSRCVAVEKLKASRQDFILVASLLDRIPNLAGLARTCEVFRAAGLAISDKSILNDKQFQLISVTAEKWVPIFEIPVGSVKIFLERKKQEGFAILGLEQTANSISLDQYVFPKKTVLVLGREKEGIPVEIIHILDACVEIPQLGVVRSLNVHVSGAIALWEYTRQQRLR